MRFPLETDGTKTDFQRAYFDRIFRFVGFTDIRLVKVQPAGLPGERRDAAIDECKAEARLAAAAF